MQDGTVLTMLEKQHLNGIWACRHGVADGVTLCSIFASFIQPRPEVAPLKTRETAIVIKTQQKYTSTSWFCHDVPKHVDCSSKRSFAGQPPLELKTT